MPNDLERFGSNLRGYLKTVPREMGRVVVQESAENFRRQGYENDNGTVVSWAPRKNVDYTTRKGKRKPNPRQRAILIKSGRLRRSVRIVATSSSSVTVGSSEAYAQAQQEGNDRGLKPRPYITLGRKGKEKLTRKIAAGITSLLSR
ncbi:phage virion morphogenesis protein [Hymenobacter negativus]|uniref:Phage virion morphogenesis protein n=1 Tax=Hymenobacter negativus TaxID=2795026 RepID=A0ABS3QDC9_9BACT|nr:phage virion morphogenesis protein [Hymenobacter negativus]MBO2009187.1 phage virion morphogenesis protein [Hymenobacter negativus]